MGRLRKALGDSPINYFSDLFVVVMVAGWVAVLLVMTAFAVYSNVVLAVTDVWAVVAELVTIPLSAGGAVWMLKNSVQHAIANANGERAHEDFPAVEGAEFGASESAHEASPGTGEEQECG